MCIGNMILDTSNVSAEELDRIINELREISARKTKMDELLTRLNDLLTEAEENDIYFEMNPHNSGILYKESINVYDRKI